MSQHFSLFLFFFSQKAGCLLIPTVFLPDTVSLSHGGKIEKNGRAFIGLPSFAFWGFLTRCWYRFLRLVTEDGKVHGENGLPLLRFPPEV